MEAQSCTGLSGRIDANAPAKTNGCSRAHGVPRPHLPVVLVVALCFWGSCSATLTCLSSSPGAALPVVAVSAVCAVLAGAAAAVRLGGRGLLALIGIALGALIASSYALGLANLEASLEDAPYSGPRTYLIVEDISQGAFGKSCFARTVLDGGETVCVRLNLPDSAELSCWDTIRVSAGLTPAREKNRAYLWQHGACAQATVRTYELGSTPGPLGVLASLRNAAVSLYRERSNDALRGRSRDEDALEEQRSGATSLERGYADGAALMQALLFGQRSQLFQSTVYDDIKRIGIAHMVAVSGAHLVVVSGFIAFLLRSLRVPRAAIVAATACFIGCYIVLTGAPVSVVRAGAMASCSLFSFFARRRSAPLSALGLVIFCIVGTFPSTALSLSFALSALATLGIALFGRAFSAWAREMFGGRLRSLADALALTFAANLYTLPLSVSVFGQLSLVAPLANAICAPLFSVLCVGGTVCTVASVFQPLRVPALSVACGAGGAFCELAGDLARMPCAAVAAWGNAAVLLGAAAIASALFFTLWPKPRAAVGWTAAVGATVCLAAYLAAAPLLHGSEIVMLDVGQGDAFVIRSERSAVMVDTGTNDAQVLQGLARNDVRHLDAIVITHPDDDHCGSLSTVLDYVQVDRVCVARDLLSCSCDNCSKLRAQMQGAQVVPLDAGDRLTFGSFTATVLAPDRFEDEGGNADSVVMNVAYDSDSNGTADITALFTGDAEAEALKSVEDRFTAVDILKVPHHGSKAGLTEELVERLEPKLALISVGKGNRYGHPKQETLDLLEQYGCTVLRTDETGDVVCSLSGWGVRAYAER